MGVALRSMRAMCSWECSCGDQRRPPPPRTAATTAAASATTAPATATRSAAAALARRARAGHRVAARCTARAVHLRLASGPGAAEARRRPRRRLGLPPTGYPPAACARPAPPPPAPAPAPPPMRVPLLLRRRHPRRSIACARRRGGLADGVADLAGLLVGFPRGAAACRPLGRAAAAIDVAGVDVGVAIDVDVGVPAAAVVVAAPGRADRGAPDHAGGQARRRADTGSSTTGKASDSSPWRPPATTTVVGLYCGT